MKYDLRENVMITFMRYTAELMIGQIEMMTGRINLMVS